MGLRWTHLLRLATRLARFVLADECLNIVDHSGEGHQVSLIFERVHNLVSFIKQQLELLVARSVIQLLVVPLGQHFNQVLLFLGFILRGQCHEKGRNLLQ